VPSKHPSKTLRWLVAPPCSTLSHTALCTVPHYHVCYRHSKFPTPLSNNFWAYKPKSAHRILGLRYLTNCRGSECLRAAGYVGHACSTASARRSCQCSCSRTQSPKTYTPQTRAIVGWDTADRRGVTYLDSVEKA
jgi:hypothetical protein